MASTKHSESRLSKFFRKRREKRLFSKAPIDEIFDYIYRANKWGDDESVSGTGSSMHQTRALRAALPGLLESLEVDTLLDAPCGDFHWLQHVPLPVERYIGADIVPALIEANKQRFAAPGRTFVALDITTDALPAADAMLCRDCLVHLDLATAGRVIENVRGSDCRYLLTTSHRALRENVNKVTGKHRLLNLELAPFGWPPPLQSIVEDVPVSGKDTGKILGVWRVADIPPPADGPRRSVSSNR